MYLVARSDIKAVFITAFRCWETCAGAAAAAAADAITGLGSSRWKKMGTSFGGGSFVASWSARTHLCREGGKRGCGMVVSNNMEDGGKEKGKRRGRKKERKKE